MIIFQFLTHKKSERKTAESDYTSKQQHNAIKVLKNLYFASHKKRARIFLFIRMDLFIVVRHSRERVEKIKIISLHKLISFFFLLLYIRDFFSVFTLLHCEMSYAQPLECKAKGKSIAMGKRREKRERNDNKLMVTLRAVAPPKLILRLFIVALW